jgi:hypothetical protein
MILPKMTRFSTGMRMKLIIETAGHTFTPAMYNGHESYQMSSKSLSKICIGLMFHTLLIDCMIAFIPMPFNTPIPAMKSTVLKVAPKV